MSQESFEDSVRSILREVGRSAERAAQGNVEAVAQAVGVDPTRAREWLDGATRWLGTHTAPEAAADPEAPADRAPADEAENIAWPPASGSERTADPLGGARPHPLDTPSADQGLALAALDSGRWSVEAGSDSLSTHGRGPGPTDAIGLFGELRAHDWITADGGVTIAGRHALTRWLAAAERP